MKAKMLVAASLVVLLSAASAAGRKEKLCNEDVNAVHEVYVAGYGNGAQWVETMVGRGDVRGVRLVGQNETSNVLKVGDVFIMQTHYIRLALFVNGRNVWAKITSATDSDQLFGDAPRAAEAVVRLLDYEMQACGRNLGYAASVPVNHEAVTGDQEERIQKEIEMNKTCARHSVTPDHCTPEVYLQFAAQDRPAEAPPTEAAAPVPAREPEEDLTAKLKEMTEREIGMLKAAEAVAKGLKTWYQSTPDAPAAQALRAEWCGNQEPLSESLFAIANFWKNHGISFGDTYVRTHPHSNEWNSEFTNETTEATNLFESLTKERNELEGMGCECK